MKQIFALTGIRTLDLCGQGPAMGFSIFMQRPKLFVLDMASIAANKNN